MQMNSPLEMTLKSLASPGNLLLYHGQPTEVGSLASNSLVSAVAMLNAVDVLALSCRLQFQRRGC